MVVGDKDEEEGIVTESGIDGHTLLYLKWITYKDLWYSTGELCSRLWQPGWEGSLRRIGTCICIDETFAIRMKLSQRCY